MRSLERGMLWAYGMASEGRGLAGAVKVVITLGHTRISRKRPPSANGGRAVVGRETLLQRVALMIEEMIPDVIATSTYLSSWRTQ